ncbi:MULTISPECIES: FecR family protein [unclassified Rhodanobacter]|uniref:FecR family protein n=1 Tax=Rhodanobacter humi TaxID=1888173 RepID=A0ABV4AQ76_9GAMM
MARIYADNIVFLMRPGEASRRRVERAPETRTPRSGEQAAPARRTIPDANAPLGYSHTLAPRTAVRDEVRQCEEAPVRRAPLLRVLLLAAACVLPMAALTWRAVAHQASLQHYTTAIGGQRTLPLPGGGSALLDTATSVSVAADAPHAVTLERGRVQFDTSGRAIVVHAGDGIVRAAAGRFQVSRLSDAVRVTALAGAVTVQLPASHEQVTLRPGQQVDYGYGRLGGVEPADLAAARGWPRGELVFHHRSLAELVAAMNRYSDTRLVIGDAALRNLPVSGVFDAGDPLALAQALQRSRLLRAVQVAPDEIVLQPAAH